MTDSHKLPTTPKGSRKIGRYHVQEQIGCGGMGVVYKAEDRAIGRKVAVKTLTETTPEMLERFYVEARSGIISHPNIVTVYELGEHEGCPFIAMEYIDGESLEQALARRGKLPVAEAVAAVEQLCAGLGYAHGHGVVHRDIKPANILLRPDGRVTIVDFGIARLADRTHALTKVDTLLGTFHYIAPERLKGETGDGRADVWSAGVILYQLLTGQLPFKGSPASAVYRVLHEPYEPLAEQVPDIPEELSRILARALDKELEGRYATAEEMAFDLKALAEASNHDRAAELLETATRLMEAEDWTNARAVLLQAQRLDPNEHGTKVLLSEVQQRLSVQQREPAQREKPAPKRRRKAGAQADAPSRPKRAPRRKPAKVEPEAAREPGDEAPGVPAFVAANPESQTQDDSLTRVLQASEFTLEKEAVRDDSPFLLPEELTARFSEVPEGGAEPAAVPEEPLPPALIAPAFPGTKAQPEEIPVPPLREAKAAKLRWLPVAAVFAVGVPLLATEMLYARRDSLAPAKPAAALAPVKPAPAPVQPVQPAPRQASLVVQATPWATVLDVTDASGAAQTLPRERSTPLRLDALEAGTYKVRMANASGLEKTVECTAAPGGQLCTAEFAAPDPARFLSARR